MAVDCLVSVIIVTYNSKKHIGDCLQGLLRYGGGVGQQIIVLDNGSQDGTCAHVARVFPQVELARLGKNLGFAAACNRGAQMARGRYLLFLNPDTRLQSDAVSKLAAVLEGRARLGRKVVCGATLVDGEGRAAKTYGYFPRLRTQIRRSAARTVVLLLTGWRREASSPSREVRTGDEAATFAVPFASGASLMVARDLFAAYGGFDERFFMYGEEADFQFRAARDGVARLVSRDARIFHEEGASFSVSMKRWVMLELSYRRFVEKNSAPFATALGFPVLSAVRWAEAVVEHALDGDYRTLLAKTRVLLRFAFTWRYGVSPDPYLRVARRGA